MMFRIKICGVTTVDDALLAVHHGADAVGINFWRPGRRWVDRATASEIASAVRPAARLVGVFVDSSVDEILDTANAVGLDCIQLHGMESGTLAVQLDRPIVQAMRGDRARAEAIQLYLQQVQGDAERLAGLLIDALHPSQPGGTGELADWQQARQIVQLFPQVPMALAGGLTAANVGDAIRLVHPAGVDVASGVESSPGKKSKELVPRFIDAARQAFDAMKTHY